MVKFILLITNSGWLSMVWFSIGLVVFLSGIFISDDERIYLVPLVTALCWLSIFPVGWIIEAQNKTNYIQLSTDAIVFDLTTGRCETETITAAVHSTSPIKPKRADDWSYIANNADYTLSIRQIGNNFYVLPSQMIEPFDGDKYVSLYIYNGACNEPVECEVTLRDNQKIQDFVW